ncbi:MAG: hypothetical protein RL189_1579, partial [Pseudomonadota bacterium]
MKNEAGKRISVARLALLPAMIATFVL